MIGLDVVLGGRQKPTLLGSKLTGLGFSAADQGGGIVISPTSFSVTDGVSATRQLFADTAGASWGVDDAGGTSSTINSASGILSIPSQTYYRNPQNYPFSTGSIWNVPLASGAVYQSAAVGNETASIRDGDPVSDGGLPNAFQSVAVNSMRVYRAKSTDPIATWTYQGRPQYLPWPYPDDPGTYYGGGTFQMRTPVDLEAFSVDGWAILIDESGRYFYETFYPTITHAPDGTMTVACRFVARNDLYDTGFPNDPTTPGRHDGIRAIGASLMGGLVRTDEIAAGRIPHGIAMVISGYQAKAAATQAEQVVWPAYHPDNGSVAGYKGVIPMGSLFAIPWNVDLDTLGLTTPEGKMLARAYQEFGGYAVDTSTGSGGGTFFVASLEVGMPSAVVTALQADKAAIINALCLVSNNASTAQAAATAGGLPAPIPVGGGGTPRIVAPKAINPGEALQPATIKVNAAGSGKSGRASIALNVAPADTVVPAIRSASTVTIGEKVRLGHPLFASEPASWTVTGGADAAQFEVVDLGIAGWWLRFAGNTVRYGANSYAVQVTATDAAGNTSAQTITVTVAASNDYGNIVRNGTFNTDYSGWVLSDDTGADVSVVSGKLRFTSDGTVAKKLGCNLQRVAVIPGRAYRLRGLLTTSGLGNTAVSLQVGTTPFSNGTGLLAFDGGAKQFDFTFTPTTPYVWLRCLFNNYASPTTAGYVEFDNIELFDTVDLYAPTFVDPKTLFSRGELGAWYDASDTSTMQQTQAGEAVVATNPVGRLYSKLLWGGSVATSLGPNLITNGDFATNDLTGWTGSSWSGALGKAKKTAGDTVALQQTGLTIGSGKVYELKFTMADRTAGTLNAVVDLSVSTTITATSVNGVGKTFYPVSAGSASRLGFVPTGTTFDGSVDDVSLKELFGRHACQNTAGLRPLWQTGGYLLFDGVDDVLPVNFGASLGSACTVAYVGADGIHLLENQTVGATFNLPNAGNRLYQAVVINRALIPQEKTDLSAYLLSRAGM
ncbi:MULTISPECIES: hypothetical protein [unclassified Rhizobium]